MSTRFIPLLALLLGIVSSTAARSETYPSRPVRFVVGSSPGATPDVIARLVGHKLSGTWGQQVLVENRTGASGTLASDQVAKSPPDGYTFLLADSSSWAINPHLYKKLPYDPARDFMPVIEFGALPMFLVVRKELPVNTTVELIAHARKLGDKLTYGSAGNGSIHHISTELFKSQMGGAMTHVPYKGVSAMAVALMGGEVDMAFMGYTTAQQGIAGGKLKLLAIGTDKRFATTQRHRVSSARFAAAGRLLR